MALGAGFFTPPPVAEPLEVVAGATGLCTLYREFSAALKGSNCGRGCQREAAMRSTVRSRVVLTENNETKYSPKKLMIAFRKLFRSHLIGLRSDCRDAVGPLPPRVRPGTLKPPPAAGPASLTAFSTAAVKAGGLAPCMVSMAEPFLKIMKVGMARTPYCDAMSFWLSTLILANVIRFGLENLVARDSNVGAIILQGPHQSAWTGRRRLSVWERRSRLGHRGTLTVSHHDGGLQDLTPFRRGSDVDSHFGF